MIHKNIVRSFSIFLCSKIPFSSPNLKRRHHIIKHKLSPIACNVLISSNVHETFKHIRLSGGSGQRRAFGIRRAWSAWPFRKDIRTFVKCFLATTCRNRVGQIGRTGKKPSSSFRRSSMSFSARLPETLHSLPRSVFALQLLRDFSRKISLLLLMKRRESPVTNHACQLNKRRSLSSGC